MHKGGSGHSFTKTLCQRQWQPQRAQSSPLCYWLHSKLNRETPLDENQLHFATGDQCSHKPGAEVHDKGLVAFSEAAEGKPASATLNNLQQPLQLLGISVLTSVFNTHRFVTVLLLEVSLWHVFLLFTQWRGNIRRRIDCNLFVQFPCIWKLFSQKQGKQV